MKRAFLTAFSLAMASTALAQVPVIDSANLKIATETSQTTDQILDTNKEVLKTVEETLKAVTGDRGSVSNPMQNLAVGQGSAFLRCRHSTASCRAESRTSAAWAVTSARLPPPSSTAFS